MAESFKWIETDESRRRRTGLTVDDNYCELAYVGFGPHEELVAEAALQSILPPTVETLPLRKWERNWIGREAAEARAEYYIKFTPQPPEVGEVTFSCDTSGGTTKITQALSQSTHVASGTAPDFKGAIGVGKNGAVEGVDIVVPALKFSLTYKMPNSVLTLGYVLTLYEMTGKTNSQPFKGFAAGELLFLGAQAREGSASDPEVTYHFAASKNRESIPVGDITVPSKRGHQYLWVRYRETDDASAKELVPNPSSAHVATVYEEADFANLQIGT